MNAQNKRSIIQRFIGMIITSALLPGNPAAAVLLWSSGPHALHTKGYMRAGGGLSDSETQVCFKAPGADVKYRLGNECEVYGKMGGYYRFTYGEGEQAPYLQYEYRFTFKGPYGEDIAQTPHVANFVEFANLAGTPAKLWVGRREYFRRDVYITDYFYMNFTGDGLSLYDIPLGFAKLGYTYIEEDVQPTNVRGEVTQRNHELSLADIETHPGGKLTLDARLSRIEGEDFAPVTIHAAGGWTLLEWRGADGDWVVAGCIRNGRIAKQGGQHLFVATINTPMITGSTPKGGQNAGVVSYPEQRASDGILPTLPGLITINYKGRIYQHFLRGVL